MSPKKIACPEYQQSAPSLLHLQKLQLKFNKKMDLVSALKDGNILQQEASRKPAHVHQF
jgi:hypothetical protein